MAECTFQPNINRRKGKAVKKSKPPTKKRLNQLANTNLEREKRLQAARLEVETRQSVDCTFKPKINKRSTQMLHRRHAPNSTNAQTTGKNKKDKLNELSSDDVQTSRTFSKRQAKSQAKTSKRLHEV